MSTPDKKQIKRKIQKLPIRAKNRMIYDIITVLYEEQQDGTLDFDKSWSSDELPGIAERLNRDLALLS